MRYDMVGEREAQDEVSVFDQRQSQQRQVSRALPALTCLMSAMGGKQTFDALPICL
jgi:hypothetical protein